MSSSSISNNLVWHKNTVSISKTVPFQTIQFTISTQSNSIRAMDRTLSGTTTLGQSGPGSNGNKDVLHIPQSSSIYGDSSSDCLVSYPGHSFGESYSSTEMPSVYSTARADGATGHSLGEFYLSAEMQSVYFSATADWARRRTSK